MMEDLHFDNEDENVPGADSLDGFYDVCNDMDAASRVTLEAEVRPVKMMLMKVSTTRKSLKLAAHLLMTNPCPAAEDFNVNPPLDYPPTSDVVEGPCGIEDESAQAPCHGTRLTHTLGSEKVSPGITLHGQRLSE